jgi:hypothetical protein
MNNDELRKNLRPVALSMQGLLCCFFLFAAMSLSISWQAKRIFLPLYAQKIQFDVTINAECAKQINATTGYYDTGKSCIECKSSVGGALIKDCDFGTVGNASAEVARTLIKESGLVFSTVGYLVGEKAYLRHTPYPLLQVHIPIWFFGLFPFFLFAFKKPKYS